MKAGGSGLHLAVANRVLILQPHDNPAMEEQASDRVHRLRQLKQVFVKRILTSTDFPEDHPYYDFCGITVSYTQPNNPKAKQTIEEKKANLQDKKKLK